MGWRIRVEHRERLYATRPCVFVGNHQSIMDLLTYGSIVPKKVVAVAKKEIGKIPLFGWFFRFSGNLVIERGNSEDARRLLAEAARRLKEEDVSVFFMPGGSPQQEGKASAVQDGRLSAGGRGRRADRAGRGRADRHHRGHGPAPGAAGRLPLPRPRARGLPRIGRGADRRRRLVGPRAHAERARRLEGDGSDPGGATVSGGLVFSLAWTSKASRHAGIGPALCASQVAPLEALRDE